MINEESYSLFHFCVQHVENFQPPEWAMYQLRVTFYFCLPLVLMLERFFCDTLYFKESEA